MTMKSWGNRVLGEKLVLVPLKRTARKKDNAEKLED